MVEKKKLFTRRDFLIGGGAATALGVLSAYIKGLKAPLTGVMSGSAETGALAAKLAGIKESISKVPASGEQEIVFEIRYWPTRDGTLCPMNVYYPKTGINPLSPGIIAIAGMQGMPLYQEEHFWKMEGLAKAGYTVLYPQLPFHGQGIRNAASEWSGERFYKTGDQDKAIGATVDFFRYQGFRDVVLTGSSLGSVRVSQYMNETKDPLVKALMHFSPTGGRSDPNAVPAQPGYSYLTMGGRAYNDVLNEILTHAGENPPHMVWLKYFAYSDSADALLELWMSDLITNSVQIQGVEVPCFFIGCTKDSVVSPAYWEALKALHPTHDIDFYYITNPNGDHSYLDKEVEVEALAATKEWLVSRGLGPQPPITTDDIRLDWKAPAGFTTGPSYRKVDLLPVIARYPYMETSAFSNHTDFWGSFSAPNQNILAKINKSPVVLFLADWFDVAYSVKGAAMWAAEALAQAGYTTFVPELPRNETRYQVSVLSDSCMPTITALVDWFVNKLGYKDVVLVGHGVGALDATRYISQTGDKRVKALVQYGPMPAMPEWLKAAIGTTEYNARVAYANELIAAGGTTAALVPVYPKPPLGGDDWITMPAPAPANTPFLMAQFAPSFLSWWGPSATTRIATYIGDVKVPILLLMGEKDNYTSTNYLDTLSDAAVKSSKVEIKTYTNAGHAFWPVAHVQASKDTIEFLASIGLAPK